MVSKLHVSIALGVAFFLSGCVAERPMWTPPSAPTAAELAPYQKSGTATLTGQGFLRQQGGGVVTCAGSKVGLVPDIPYTRAAAAALREGKQIHRMASDGTLGAAGRVALCDAQGNFSFTDLPPGNYLLTTLVQWTVGYAPQGGVLLGSATLIEGKKTSVFLTELVAR